MNDIERLKFVVQDRDRLCEEDFQAIENVLKKLKIYKKALKNVSNELEKYKQAYISETTKRAKLIDENIELKSELKKYKNIISRYEMECKMFRAFCRRIRKTEKRDVDEFNQGREYAYIQFLNLISGEPNWEHEGKYFDEVEKEMLNWARKEV